MNDEKQLLPKPEWKWYYSLLFFTRGAKDYFNFVENSWWNKKNHQYDNLKTNFV